LSEQYTHFGEVQDIGVDWITATSKQRDCDSGLHGFGRFLVQESADAGNKLTSWRMSGYRGLAAGGAAVGMRGDGCVVRLSSAFAAVYWNQVVDLASKVTRIDLQVTTKMEYPGTKAVARAYRQMKRAPKAKGKPPKFKLWVGPSGPEALMLGVRQSNRFGRCYDKGLESGLPEFENCLRAEVEYKGSQATSNAGALSVNENPNCYIADQVSLFLKNRGIRIPWHQYGVRGAAVNTIDNPRAHYFTDNPLRSLWWFDKCVRSSVERLCKAGMRDEVINSLGLRDFI